MDGKAGNRFAWSEAFRCPGANLLPVTKFIARALFTKCLGQVDLPGAPLRHRSPRTGSPPSHPLLRLAL
ncbi:hypothetical protein F210042A8_10040 [Blautia parvula]